MNPRTIALLGALVAIALIVVIAFTTSGLPSYVPPIIGVGLFGLVALSARKQARIAARILAAMTGKGPMTITEVLAALADDHVKRASVIASLASLRGRGQVTREAISPEAATGPDTHRYTT